MAGELTVLFVGTEADSRQLAALLASSLLAAERPVVTRVSSWRTFTSLTTGWDVVIAGGPMFPTAVDHIRDSMPIDFDVPVIAFVEPPLPAEPTSLVEWLRPDEFPRLVPILRILRRAVVAETRGRTLDERVALMDRQLRQAGRLRALGQMSAGIAHEFNNLLTVISGYCEQLVPRARDIDGLERLVRPIQQAGARGAELSQRLLTFSREQAPAVGDVSVTAALHEAAAMLRPLLGEKVSLRMHLDHSVPRVRGQAGPLIEVITNLAVNARDAMPGGGVITIETTAISADDHSDGPLGHVALIVRDTGIGMDAETLARACEPFFSTKADGAGTGLGLALVRDIVQQCGGTLAIDSTVGVGTAVTVALPAVCPDYVVVTDTVPPESAFAGGPETILLVEDDASVREIVAEFLRGAAYEVLEASDSEQALALVRRGPTTVDLLVTDIVLPGQSGPELAGALRRFAPQMRTLFISGYPSEPSGETRSPAFLAKPFSRAALLQAVRSALTAPRHREVRETDSEGRLVTREPNVIETNPRDRSH